jgi:hypothetical protein
MEGVDASPTSDRTGVVTGSGACFCGIWCRSGRAEATRARRAARSRNRERYPGFRGVSGREGADRPLRARSGRRGSSGGSMGRWAPRGDRVPSARRATPGWPSFTRSSARPPKAASAAPLAQEVLDTTGKAAKTSKQEDAVSALTRGSNRVCGWRSEPPRRFWLGARLGERLRLR